MDLMHTKIYHLFIIHTYSKETKNNNLNE